MRVSALGVVVQGGGEEGGGGGDGGGAQGSTLIADPAVLQCALLRSHYRIPRFAEGGVGERR